LIYHPTTKSISNDKSIEWWGLWMTIVILAFAVLLLLYGIVVYNRLVRLRALVREGWAGIDVQLRRRADLIPNLVSTVKGYATHERELLEAVTLHRTDAVTATGVGATAQADAQLSGMLGRIFALSEAYPDLKADANFRQLQEELAETEDQLAGARRYYNATVRDLNTRIESFPDVLLAGAFGFKAQEPYTETDAAVRATPQVSFGSSKA
jgi:LemA protein